MKKIICIFIALCVCLSFVSCKTKPEGFDSKETANVSAAGEEDAAYADVSVDIQPEQSDMLEPEEEWVEQPEISYEQAVRYFEQIHPGCTATRDHNGYYSVTNSDISIEEFKTPELTQRQTDDSWTRESLASWLLPDALEWTAVFKGETTGRTVQTANYFAWQLPATPVSAYTLTEFKVTEVYYGLLEVNDTVWVADNYGVVYENGEKKLYISNESCTNGLFQGEYLIHADRDYTADIPNYYSLGLFFALPLDREYTPQGEPNVGLDYAVYEKYILNKDIALHREEETEKQLRYNGIFLSHVQDRINEGTASEELIQEFNEIAEAGDSLTQRQEQMIEDALKRFGERKERVKNAG